MQTNIGFGNSAKLGRGLSIEEVLTLAFFSLKIKIMKGLDLTEEERREGKKLPWVFYCEIGFKKKK